MSEMRICHICAIPYGHGTSIFEPRCLCRRTFEEPRWSYLTNGSQITFDYNEHTTLCQATDRDHGNTDPLVESNYTLLALIAETTRSIWNRSGASPLDSSYSLMHGVGLTGTSTKPEIHAFTRQLNSLFERMNDLFEWRKVRLAFNLARLGDAWKGDPDLTAYLSALTITLRNSRHSSSGYHSLASSGSSASRSRPTPSLFIAP